MVNKSTLKRPPKISRTWKKVSILLLTALLIPLTACQPSSTPAPQAASNTPTRTTIPSATLPAATQAFTATPTQAPTSTVETPQPTLHTPIASPQALQITVLYDNYVFDERLTTSWGFSALVEYGAYTMLFDTGESGAILLENMQIMEVDPTQIESILLSHGHSDHTGGLFSLLEVAAQPVVYLLPSFSNAYERQVEQFSQFVEVSPGLAIHEGLYTTGSMGRSIPEQALVIETAQGLVVVTGCAHPGIVAILEKVQELFGEPIYLVLGGFHLGGASEAEITAILEDFRRLGVERVAPSHCTGELAISMFAAEYGEDFIQAGVGKIIQIDAPNDGQ